MHARGGIGASLLRPRYGMSATYRYPPLVAPGLHLFRLFADLFRY